ncbi:hypothetical protein [Leclercia adecarboxylata]|nr:hypothetical protein [Leclercia adecarboxylata]
MRKTALCDAPLFIAADVKILLSFPTLSGYFRWSFDHSLKIK